MFLDFPVMPENALFAKIIRKFQSLYYCKQLRAISASIFELQKNNLWHRKNDNKKLNYQD